MSWKQQASTLARCDKTRAAWLDESLFWMIRSHKHDVAAIVDGRMSSPNRILKTDEIDVWFLEDAASYSTESAFDQLLPRYEGYRGQKVCRTELGKPVVSGFSISFSHSAGKAVAAVAKGGVLGIDLEQRREDLNFESIVSDHFTSFERSEYTLCHPDDRSEFFYKVWTRKEATLKAIGSGLRIPPSRIEVVSSGIFTFHSLAVPSPFTASVACNNSNSFITYLNERALLREDFA